MRRRGDLRALSLIEIIIGFLVLAIAGSVLFSNISSSYRFSGMTTNRTAATIVAGNFVEEIKAHEYGQPAPKSWPAIATDSNPPAEISDNYDPDDPNYERIEMLVYGRNARFVFYRQLRLENGSFLDSSKPNKTDKIFFTIWWREKTSQTENAFKSLVLEMGVRSPW